MLVGDNVRLVAFLNKLEDLCRHEGVTILNLGDMDVSFDAAGGLILAAPSVAGPPVIASVKPRRKRKKPVGMVGPRRPLDGEKVKELMGEAGVSQATLSRSIGASDTSVSRWIRGIGTPPTTAVIRSIATALGVTFESLLIPVREPVVE